MTSADSGNGEFSPGKTSPTGPTWTGLAVALGLFAVTAFTTTTLGAIWSVAVRTDATTSLLPWLSIATVRAVWSDPALLRLGLSFSIPALTILGAHELGHLVACRYYRIDTSYPFFLPLPVALGTLGAFIRIRDRMRTRRQVFDIGLAGPFAGFVVLLPFLVFGAARSSYAAVHLTTQPTEISLLQPGLSPLVKLVLSAFHGPIPVGEMVNLHPFALAAWVGLLVTGLNLLPLAQLDGGHALYALSPCHYPRASRIFWLGLLIAGWWWPGWWVWAGLTAVMRLRHPPVVDPREGLDARRRWVAVLAVLMFAISWTLVPLATINLLP